MDPRAQMLGSMAIELPRELNTIEGQLRNILELFHEFVNSLNDKYNALGDMQTEFDEALESYKTIFEGHHHYLDGLIDKLENLSASVLKAVNETQEDLVEALVEIQKEQIEAIVEQMTHAKQQKQDWWEQWRNGSILFQQKAMASQASLEKNVSEVQDFVKSLGHLVAEGRELSEAKVETLSQRMQQVHHDAGEKVQQMSTLFEEMHEQFSQQLNTAREHQLGPQIGKLLEGFEQKLTGELTPKMDEHTSGLGECVAQLAEQLISSRDRSSSVRQELAPQADAVNELVNPIGSALEAAKEAVGKVGLTLG
ncbi:MAG: hypothetical protein ACR2IE_10560 [Candidatus Sumerlaeaceae bacterium]